VLPTLSESYTVLGGNSVLVEKLLRYANAQVYLNSTVTTITKTADRKYQITTEQYKSQQSILEFDTIIIAAPIEFINITFVNIQLPVFTKRNYQHWYVTLVAAAGLNPLYFGTYPVPDNILTTSNSTAPFHVLQILKKLPSNILVYKTFSNEPLSDELLDQLYLARKFTLVQHWLYTFPALIPNTEFQAILLDDHIYNLNAIESVATAMEGSTIAGRNAAQLISSNFCT